MSHLVGMGQLIRLMLRLDRITLPLWVLTLAVLPAVTVMGFAELFPEEAQRVQFFTATATQPAYVALVGPGFGPGLGALATQRSGIVFVLVALASILTVVRHTRSEEDAGRRELLGATVVGRHAPLAGALVFTLAADLVLGALLTAGLLSQGLATGGSLAFGAAVTLTGWVFAGAAGLTAQLVGSAGGARGLALASLGVAFVLRAAGDAAGATSPLRWLSWLSPIGWMQRTRAFAGERWWVLLLGASASALLVAAAFTVSSRRDVGAGVFPQRLGRAAASDGFRSPMALAWRLQRGLFWGWTVSLATFGVVVGAITEAVADALEGNEQLRAMMERMGGAGLLADAYLAATVGFMGIVASAYAVQSASRLRTEEESLRGELLLATATGRLRWAASHLVIALGGPALAVLAFGATAGLVYGLTVQDVGGQWRRVVAAAATQIPAVWCFTGIAVAVFGLVPKWTSLAWGALLACLLLGQFGAILQLPEWVLRLSPFTHLPQLPGGEVSVTPLALLTAGTLALLVVGLGAFRRRDFGV